MRSIPRAISWVAIAVFAIYFTLPWIALSAMPVVHEGGQYVDAARPAPPHGFKNDPVLGLVENLGLHGARAVRGEGLRRDPRRDDPLHRDERRRDRRVAHHVRDVEPPAAAGGLPPAASEAEDAVARADRLRRRSARRSSCSRARSTSSGACTRSARCSRSRSRTRSWSRCACKGGDEELEWRARPNFRFRGVDWPVFAIVGGLGTGARVARRRRSRTPPTRYAGFAWLAAGFVFYVALPAPAAASRSRVTSRAPVPLGAALALEYRSILVPIVAGQRVARGGRARGAPRDRARGPHRAAARDRRAARAAARRRPDRAARGRARAARRGARDRRADTACASSSASCARAMRAGRSSTRPSAAARRSSSSARRAAGTTRSSATPSTTC